MLLLIENNSYYERELQSINSFLYRIISAGIAALTRISFSAGFYQLDIGKGSHISFNNAPIERPAPTAAPSPTTPSGGGGFDTDAAGTTPPKHKPRGGPRM